jgi:diguanylate cyclase (GGDEF)-like protein
VNDRFGHAVGDQVLAEVASRLRQVAREEDRVARLGGDEFALLQRGVADDQGALRLAERLVEAVSQPITVDVHQLRVGISIGIAMVPPAEGAEAKPYGPLVRRAALRTIGPVLQGASNVPSTIDPSIPLDIPPACTMQVLSPP